MEIGPEDFRGGASVSECVQNAIWHLLEAKKRNDAEQEKHKPGTPAWHAHETIDDRLHDALSELGE